MANSLTRNAGFRVGPLVLETLIKHYFDHVSKGKGKGKVVSTGNLRQDELLYDEAFTIVKVGPQQACIQLQAHSDRVMAVFLGSVHAVQTGVPLYVLSVSSLTPQSHCRRITTILQCSNTFPAMDSRGEAGCSNAML